MLAGNPSHAQSNRNMRVITAVFIFLIFGGVACADTIRIYHVGNSLTVDCNVELTSNALRKQGHTVEQGYHLACGYSLHLIESRPDYTCADFLPPGPYGTWTNALAKYEWDVITLQAYPGATGLQEVTATKRIIETALAGNRNRNCKFFLVLGWPTQSASASYRDLVDAPFGGDAAPTFLSTSFLNYWYQAMTTLFPDLDIRAIPTGAILGTMEQKLKLVNIAVWERDGVPAYPPAEYTNAYTLYRDPYHMSWDGRHLAGTAMLAAVTGIRPQRSNFPDAYNFNIVRGINSNLVSLIHDVVWSSICRDPRTKVAVVPELTLTHNILGGIYECSFVGKLFQSTDAKQWDEVSEATSPYRFAPVHPAQFFRAGR